MKKTDLKSRCFGHQPGKDEYAKYHDEEWGRPQYEDRHLLEMLVLEGAQAGLNWETILKRRDAYRHVFHNFDPEQVAAMTDGELEQILLNPAIIRNRKKIFSARQNARVFVDIQKEFGSYNAYHWSFVGHKPIQNHWKTLKDVPAFTQESMAYSKDLRKRGMSFVGPTIIYAYMQAVGLVNDHLTDCWLYTKDGF